MSEKIGSAKGSKLDDDFIELERVRTAYYGFVLFLQDP